jgi:hypothetical protein
MIIADALEEAYTSDEVISDLVRQVRREKLTNIGRFFSPDVLRLMHFELRADDSSNLRTRTLFARHPSDQLRDFFVWALKLILENSVDAYKNAAIRQQALMTVAHLIPPPEDAADEPFRLSEALPNETESYSSSGPVEREEDPGLNSAERPDGSSGKNFSSANEQNSRPEVAPGGGGDGEKKPQRTVEARPERYLLQNLRLPNHPDRIQRLLKECRGLDMFLFPSIACVMIRVMVELSVSTPESLQLSGAAENEPLPVKIKAMLKYLDPHIENQRTRDRELAQAYMEATELGVQYLNGFVHNSRISPDHHLARRFSSAFRPLLTRVDEAL